MRPRLGVDRWRRVVVRSDWGELEAAVRIDDAVRPGVVSIEHGWGRQSGMRLATDKPGVNINRLLPSGPGSFDPLSNQAWMTGIPVTVERRSGEADGSVDSNANAVALRQPCAEREVRRDQPHRAAPPAR